MSITSDLGAKIRTSLFGGEGKPSFPDLYDYNDIYEQGKPNKNFSKSLGYGFRVVNEDGLRFRGWDSFILQINPQTLQQDEEFSIQFFPTPKGITVEHQGSIMKDIVISGTTGIHPKRNVSGINKNGNIILGTGDSGYKQFHDLRNYIRAYAEQKKNPNNARLRLAFYNFKDNEFYFVEPLKFSLKRDKSRPMLYEYNIVMKSIGRIEDGAVVDTNAWSKFVGDLNDFADSVANIINVARGILLGLIDLLTSIDRDIRAKVLNPLNTLSLAIDDFRNGKTAFINLPRKFIKDLKAAIRDISDKLANRSGADTTGYNSFAGKPNIFTPDVPRESTREEREAIAEFNHLEIALELIAFNGQFFAEPGGTSNSVVQIKEGETVQDIAARMLGDASLFTEIIKINNLKYPYIAKNRADGVLSYDDKIMIPTESTVDTSIKNVVRNIEYQITKNMTEAEKNFGTDIKLGTNQDIAITNTGDFDLVAGAPCVVQSLGVRLGVERGGYKLHTRFGLSMSIGEKSVFDVALLKSEVESQLRQDERIDKKIETSITIKGNQIIIDLFIKLKNTGQQAPLQLVAES